MIVSIVGFLATFVSFFKFAPSAFKVWVNRNDFRALRGVSVTMNVLVIVSSLLWFWYSYLTGAFWAGAQGFVNIPFAVASIFWVVRAKRREQQF